MRTFGLLGIVLLRGIVQPYDKISTGYPIISSYTILIENHNTTIAVDFGFYFFCISTEQRADESAENAAFKC